MLSCRASSFLLVKIRSNKPTFQPWTHTINAQEWWLWTFITYVNSDSNPDQTAWSSRTDEITILQEFSSNEILVWDIIVLDKDFKNSHICCLWEITAYITFCICLWKNLYSKISHCGSSAGSFLTHLLRE